MIKKRGQVWVETVIYTLIAFVMIGLVLSYAKPKIEELQDKIIIEQSMGVIKDISNVILSLTQGGAGNTRLIELEIKKGVLEIDGVDNEILFKIESKHIYSQPGEEYQEGDIVVTTEKKGEFHLVTLKKDYNGEYNVTYKEEDKLKLISKSSTPYKLLISNKGKIGDEIVIDFEVN